jgi:hypothetical protein
MATERGTFGWETLAPHDGGRRLMNPEKDHTVAAKVRTGDAARGHLFLDLCSREAGWSILVPDEQFRPVAQAFGERKSDVWDEVEGALKSRGLLGS